MIQLLMLWQGSLVFEFCHLHIKGEKALGREDEPTPTPSLWPEEAAKGPLHKLTQRSGPGQGRMGTGGWGRDNIQCCCKQSWASIWPSVMLVCNQLGERNDPENGRRASRGLAFEFSLSGLSFPNCKMGIKAQNDFAGPASNQSNYNRHGSALNPLIRTRYPVNVC